MRNIVIFSYHMFSVLIETALLSTHNICFGCVITKIIFNYTLLSEGLTLLCYSYFHIALTGLARVRKFNRFKFRCNTYMITTTERMLVHQ